MSLKISSSKYADKTGILDITSPIKLITCLFLEQSNRFIEFRKMLKQEGLITTKVTPKPLNFTKSNFFDQIVLDS